MRRFPPEQLEHVRKIELLKVLELLSTYYTQDRTFVPKENPDSRLFAVEIQGNHFRQLLITGEKWFDLNAEKGGGGAIDLTMHLLKVDFVNAVKILAKKEKQWNLSNL